MEVERRSEERRKQQLRRAVKEREWRDDMRDSGDMMRGATM